jgi:hypothetical protein
MDPRKRNSGAFSAAAIGVAAVVVCSGVKAQMHSSQHSISNASEQAKIASALSAAPPNIAKAAAVAEMDDQGKMKILRAGTNGFTRMPGNPDGPGEPPMCLDQVAMQWSSDFEQHRPKPTPTVPRIHVGRGHAAKRL